MNKRIVIHLVSIVIAIVGIAMFFTGFVSWLMDDPRRDTLIFLTGAVITFLPALILALETRPRNTKDLDMGMREGFLIVVFSWLMSAVFGCIPLILVVKMFWHDAFFEMVSGFTTTGATVIDSTLILMDGSTLPNGVESLPHCILFWRALSHWLGGMGIVVLSLAILPFLNIGGQVLYNAEVTGVKSKDSRLTPRIAGTAKLLWIVYLVLTAAEVFLLSLAGLSVFDAVCESFSTIATGGFSTKSASISSYNSSTVNWIITVFMFLAGCNFVLHYRAITGRPWKYWKDEEFRFYSLLILGCVFLITLFLYLTPIMGVADSFHGKDLFHHLLRSLEYASFEVVATITTTGFSNADYTIWPTFCGMILFGLMFVGACGGSTTGGLKCVRVLVLIKYVFSVVKRCLYPRMVPAIRLNGSRLEDSTIQKTVGFFVLFMASYFILALLLPLVCEMRMDTALSASITCLSNVGPGFAEVAPTKTFAWMNGPAKILLSFGMLLGRLELFTILVLFLPSFWRK